MIPDGLLRGRSAALSVETVERILDACPDASFEELLGRPPRTFDDAPWPMVKVVHAARASRWHPIGQPSLDPFTLPVPVPKVGPDPFGVTVSTPGAETLYLEGTILVCSPVSVWAGEPPSLSRVVIRRERDGRYEITVWQLVHDGREGQLMPMTAYPGMASPIALTLPLGEPIRWGRRDTLTIIGAVVAAWQPEPASFHI